MTGFDALVQSHLAQPRKTLPGQLEVEVVMAGFADGGANGDYIETRFLKNPEVTTFRDVLGKKLFLEPSKGLEPISSLDLTRFNPCTQKLKISGQFYAVLGVPQHYPESQSRGRDSYGRVFRYTQFLAIAKDQYLLARSRPACTCDSTCENK